MLTIIRGVPGTGKSTYAQTHFKGTLCVENDMFHIHNGKYDYHREMMPDAIAWCVNTVRFALIEGMDVVVCNTFTKRSFIEKYKRLAEKYGHDFKVIRMTKEYGNVHNLPSKVMEEMRNGFEDYEGEEIVG